MLALFIVIAVVVVGAAALSLLAANRRFDEVERFHRASRMTTEWARRGITAPPSPRSAAAEERRQHADV